MRIGLLICDHFDPSILDAAGGDYDLLYGGFLQAADPTLEIVPYDVVNGVLPAEPDECDGWLITGSRYDAFADTPWIEDLRAFVRKVHEHEARLAGICFGHQVIAQALGGQVERAGSWKVGPHPFRMAPQPWFEGGELAISSMHRDIVTRLPEGASVIAEGSTAAVPAYLVGHHILGIQGHPEYDETIVEALVGARQDLFEPNVASDARTRLRDIETEGDEVGRWIVSFLKDQRVGECRVESVQVGGTSHARVGSREVETGFVKAPVGGAIVRQLGLDGDVVADELRHGGVDQAVYVYTRTDYVWWEQELGRALPAGSFGENLTISSVGSSLVRVGDRFRIGEVELEVTGPRSPCGVFAAMMEETDWAKRFNDARRPGFYCRVISEGRVESGDAVTRIAAGEHNVSVVELVDVHLDHTATAERLRKILESPIAERARAMYVDRLARLEAAAPTTS